MALGFLKVCGETVKTARIAESVKVMVSRSSRPVTDNVLTVVASSPPARN
jgi:hypothetical protein